MPPSSRWTPIGPIGLRENDDVPALSIMSGRVTAVAPHPTDPNVVFIGTAGGGVWSTNDGGLSWKPLGDHSPGPSIGAIALDPSKPERVYVGTGEANLTPMQFEGEGLLVREDATSPWQPVPLPRSPTNFSAIVVSSTGDRIFLATDRGLIERSRSGSTWTDTVVSHGALTTLVYDEAADRLYAGASGRIFVRNGTGPLQPIGLPNDAETGSQATSLPDPSVTTGLGRVTLAWSAQEPAVLFAAFERSRKLFGIFRSDDQGRTWNVVAQAPPPPATGTGIFGEPQAGYSLVLARSPNDVGVLFLGLVSLQRSTDRGQKWLVVAGTHREGAREEDEEDDDEPAPTDPAHTAERSTAAAVHVDQHAIAFGPGRVVWLGNDGGIWRSDDDGVTWHHRNRGLAAMQFYSGQVHRDVAALATAGAQDNGTQLHEGHPIWRRIGGGDGGPVGIDARSRRWFRTGPSWSVEYAERLSSEWKALLVPGGNQQWLPVLALSPTDPSIVYLGTTTVHRAIMRMHPSFHELTAFTQQASGALICALAVAHDDPRNVYVADANDRVVHLFADPISPVVTPLPTMPSFAGRISAIAVSVAEPDLVYVAVGEIDNVTRRRNGSRFLRRRGTGPWEDLTARLPDYVTPEVTRVAGENAVHTIAIAPDDRIFLGCDRGVLVSRDRGDTWTAIGDGLPVSPVRQLSYQPSRNRLQAFTHGRSAWERDADVAPAPQTSVEVDLYVRDHRYDQGLANTEAESRDPLGRLPYEPFYEDEEEEEDAEPRVTLRWTDGADIKVDREAAAAETTSEEESEDEEEETDPPPPAVDPKPAFQRPASTVDYTPTGALDCIGFEMLEHREPRIGAPARVHLQVHNRGPDPAANVVARIFWGPRSSDGTWPDLAADFWTSFPNGTPSPPWRAIGDAKTIPELRPAEPGVVTWEWSVPLGLPTSIGILAVVTCAADPVFEGVAPGAMSRRIESLVRGNKRISLKATNATRVAPSALARKIGKIAEYAAFGFLIGVGGLLLYEGIESLRKD